MHDRDRPTSAPAKPRILFVDDEPKPIREHLADALSDAYVVETAGNGAEALKAVLRAKPELIVTDIVMPDMDGVELLKTLRSVVATQRIPVLLISGRAPEEQRVEGFKEGADGYLAKPYTECELRALIGSMLQGARLRQEAAGREAREQAEQQALVERAALLESITDAFYALDRQWRYTYVNQRALDYYGKAREELLGQCLWEVFPVAKGSTFHTQYERALREQCSVAFETVSPLTGRWLDVHAYPTAQGLAVNFRDISRRKRTEQELQSALTQLKEADRRKTEFLAILAHELRNPLAPIRNGLQILQRRAAEDPMLPRTVNMMDRQLTHLVRLVDDLLDVGRITCGKLELKRQTLLLTEVLGSAVEASRAFIAARWHELVVAVQVEGLRVDGDPNRLAQVFSNLLFNSAKYTDRAGLITLTLERENDEAVITVQDNGIGIPPPALESVFQMFSQVHAPRTEGGLGIGLCLVRSLVQMHGGSVTAFSEGLGLGSTFTVRLPLAEGAAATPDVAAQPGPRSRSDRILVVDDNADAAEFLALLLEMEGHTVRTAADGEEAIEQAQAFDPDTIFMDLGMPRLDGVEAARRIRQLPRGRRVRIVALTGWGQEADRQRTREAGMDEHLVKPVTLEALQRVLGARGRA
jgi:PAS domain S-box-containing protein